MPVILIILALLFGPGIIDRVQNRPATEGWTFFGQPIGPTPPPSFLGIRGVEQPCLPQLNGLGCKPTATPTAIPDTRNPLERLRGDPTQTPAPTNTVGPTPTRTPIPATATPVAPTQVLTGTLASAINGGLADDGKTPCWWGTLYPERLVIFGDRVEVTARLKIDKFTCERSSPLGAALETAADDKFVDKVRFEQKDGVSGIGPWAGEIKAGGKVVSWTFLGPADSIKKGYARLCPTNWDWAGGTKNCQVLQFK